MKKHFLKGIDKVVGASLARLLPRSSRTGLSTYSVNRLLIIRPGGIGDAVLLIPAIKRLRELFPAARIEVLAEVRNRGVFALCPVVDSVFCYDKLRDWGIVFRRNYDVVIDTEQWYRLSAVVARLVRSRIKIGFATNERKRLFTHPVSYDQNTYESYSFLELLNSFEDKALTELSRPFLTVPEDAQKTAADILGPLGDGPFIVLFPGASIPERCWGVDKFRHLAAQLADAGFSVVVVGGQEDVVAGHKIVTHTTGVSLAGVTTLSETAAILSRAQLLVSGDSGVLHIAVGLDVPTVSLFGPGIAKKWAHQGQKHIVLNHKLSCSPCTRFGITPPCPIGARCLQEISVEEVLGAVQQQLSEIQREGSV